MSKNTTFDVIVAEEDRKMDNREFEIFVRACRDKLLYTAKNYVGDLAEAEDIVQDAVLKLYAMRHALAGYRSPEALAVTIVRHLAIDALRRKERHPEIRLDDNLSVEDKSVDERVDEVLRAMEKLPPKQQLILRMKHIEGLECEEIADIAQMGIDAVYQNLSRARRAILKQFKSKSHD